MPLKPALSAYLDFLRFVAALAVLLGHMELDHLSLAWMPLQRFSHEAVMVFFVLSGFIIHHSTVSRAATWQQYVVARVSRIYSVALPSVLVCVLLSLWVSGLPGFDPKSLGGYRPFSWWDIFSSLFFLNPVWTNMAELTLNGPYWSLCYEVWFYILFGVFLFTDPSRRKLLVGLAAVLAGPPILVLLPVWLMGVWLSARKGGEYHWSMPRAWVLFLVPILLMVVVNYTALDRQIQLPLYEHVPGYWRLQSSQRFVTDYLIGGAVVLHIAAFSSLPAAFQGFFLRHQKRLASLAGFSFTLYLFHRPMTQLLGAWYPQPAGAVWMPSLLTLGVLLACWGTSWATEKQLPRWRRLIGARWLNGPVERSARG